MTIEDVIKWCDEKSQDGKEVAICWEGGGDSGWVYIQVDGESSSDPEAEWLVDRMCSILDYGSWAGEFNANGIAVYDPVTKMFEGEDIYSEDTTESLELQIENAIVVKIPKKFYFDELEINIENILDGGTVSIVPKVKNGFLSTELITLCESLQDDFIEKALEALNGNVPNAEWSGWQTEQWDEEGVAEAAKLDYDNYIFRVTSLEYVGYEESLTGVCIDLKEYAENLNDQEL